MNKKHILALLSLLFVNIGFGRTKDKDATNLEDMNMPEEVSVNAPQKSPNPFLKQEKKRVEHFDTKKAEDVFDSGNEGPFRDIDPWDD